MAKKMNLYPMSKHKAEESNQLKEPHVIISINFPKESAANPVTNEYTKEMLRFYISDVGRSSNPVPPPEVLANEMKQCVPFNKEIANEVLDLLERTKVEHVIIHCLMGTSRSASMANAISEYYNGEQVTKFPSINYLIHDVMLEELEKRYGKLAEQEEVPSCCYVCEHENPVGYCDLLNKKLDDVFAEDFGNSCPPLCCPLRETVK